MISVIFIPQICNLPRAKIPSEVSANRTQWIKLIALFAEWWSAWQQTHPSGRHMPLLCSYNFIISLEEFMEVKKMFTSTQK
mgnify:FL=1